MAITVSLTNQKHATSKHNMSAGPSTNPHRPQCTLLCANPSRLGLCEAHASPKSKSRTMRRRASWLGCDVAAKSQQWRVCATARCMSLCSSRSPGRARHTCRWMSHGQDEQRITTRTNTRANRRSARPPRGPVCRPRRAASRHSRLCAWSGRRRSTSRAPRPRAGRADPS